MKFIKIVLIGMLGLIMILIGFVGVLTLLEYRPDDVETLDVTNEQTQQLTIGESFSLMTFNIGYAGLGKNEDFVMDGGKKGRPDSKAVVEGYLAGILDTLSEYPVDIYLLQEVDVKARRSYHINQVQEIATHLGSNFGYSFAYNFKAPFVPFPLSLSDHIGYVESGIATYQTFQTTEVQRYQFPGAFGWPLRVANLKRAMMVTTIPLADSDKKFIVINLHMSAYDGDGSLRAQEMQMLKEMMIAYRDEGHYVIVGGDFNQTFPEAVDIYPVSQDFYVAYPIESDWLPSGFSFEIDLNHPTCRLLNQPYDPSDSMTQYYIIDGFIVSDNVEIVMQAQTLSLNFEHSDHNPVFIEVRLKP